MPTKTSPSKSQTKSPAALSADLSTLVSTRSTCCYCGTGCGVVIDSQQQKIVGVRGDAEHPANQGRLCTKGASLHLTALDAGRALFPERRSQQAPGQPRLQPLQVVSWDDALDEAAERFASIIRAHGPDAVAFYVSGQLLTEDYYVFNKLAKGLIGTNNIDTNSRLCMSSAVVGYKQTLGADAPPCSYADIDLADLMLIAGANPAVAHPVLFRRIEEARANNPALKIIVVDPRPSETSQIADLHLAIAPGTDIALFNGLLQILISEDRLDHDFIAAHTEGFAALAAEVAHYPPEVAARICGIAAGDLVTAAHWFADAGQALSLYCQGLNQSSHGTHNNAAIIHLHLATGQIGKPGAGPFSLTGQPNAMGGREVGGLATLMSGHRELSNPAHRAEMARFWGVPSVPQRPGKTAVELFQAIERGEIKAVWIACTNPAQSLPDQAAVRAALDKAEYVVLQEAYRDTDTAAYADLLLPAASWGEKEGTVTNSERCISRVRAAVPPPGAARPDWAIIVDFAHRLGARLDHPAAERLFPYRDVESIFNEHRATTTGRDLDISGLSYALLETAGPQQWPLPAGQTRGTARLYLDHRFATPSGKARFVLVGHRPLADVPSPRYPLSLLSGRLRDQWHGMSRTGKVARLYNDVPEPQLLLSGRDALARGLLAGDLARLHSARGELVLRVAVDPQMPAGRAWLPMHWGSRFMQGAGVNALIFGALDPYSQQPELKHAAVEVSPAALPWPLAALRRCADQEEALALMAAAHPLLAEFEYASLGQCGGKNPVVALRAAAAQPFSAELTARIDQLFKLDDAEGVIEFHDRRQQVSKRALLADGRLVGVRLIGEAVAFPWLRDALAAEQAEGFPARFAVAPLDAPPAGLAPPRKIVCKCADIDEDQLSAALAAGQSLPIVQETLKCGTFCGSCVPELRKLAARLAAQASPAPLPAEP